MHVPHYAFFNGLIALRNKLDNPDNRLTEMKIKAGIRANFVSHFCYLVKFGAIGSKLKVSFFLLKLEGKE